MNIRTRPQRCTKPFDAVYARRSSKTTGAQTNGVFMDTTLYAVDSEFKERFVSERREKSADSTQLTGRSVSLRLPRSRPPATMTLHAGSNGVFR